VKGVFTEGQALSDGLRRLGGSPRLLEITLEKDFYEVPNRNYAGVEAAWLMAFQASNPPVRFAISRKPARRRMLVAIELR